jgi:hypothetical protein
VDSTPEQLQRLALEYLRSEEGVEDVVRRDGRIGQPIPVEHPRGSVTHWFVPVAVDTRLAGYFLFDAHPTFQRYSSFLRRANSVEGAPDLESWTEPARVLKTAAGSAHAQKLGEPYLTYDGVLARLAWAVPVESESGILYVAGNHAYTRPLSSDSTG